MQRKLRKGNTQAHKAASSGNGGNLLEAEAQRVRELIADHHSKSAVEIAKNLHKSCGTAESEALLLDAYRCRMWDLLKLGMAIEAKALLKMVCERFSASRPQWEDLKREIAVDEGRLDEVVGPLQDPSLPMEVRGRIEATLRQRVHDLSALAVVTSLPPEHPLREGAAALAAALQAVTTGPVEDAILALPEVSRRSPLASWKALMRAISCFYRKEDEACKQWLHAIADDSVPARAVPALESMLGRNAARLSVAEQRLIAAVGVRRSGLRPALATLEKAFAAKKQRPILEAARAAVAACDRANADLYERLRQHITIRCLALGISRSTARSAIGVPREDAYFFRLLATSLERSGDVYRRVEAVTLWEDFRREAIRGKWFVSGGLEDGVLSLHMAEMIARTHPEVIEEMRDAAIVRMKRSEGGLAYEDLLSPEALYKRACHADPNPDAFQMWLQWTEKHRTWKVADNVAELWLRTDAKNIRPLLYLMDSTEKRGAYKKSLKYLEDAEDLDRLNPDVRRAKLRLLLAAAMRHLRQRKTNLAMTEIERMAALPEGREEAVAALVAALRRTCADLDRDIGAMRAQEEKLLELLGGIVPVFVLITGLRKAGNLDSSKELPPLNVADLPAAELLAGITRACALGDWVGLPLHLPHGWERPLIDALVKASHTLDTAQLLVLGEAALRSQAVELAYAVSAAGLATGAADARFLFLRGRSLPQWASERREGCFSAALELARRERNTELAGKVLDQLGGQRKHMFGSYAFIDTPNTASRPMPAELLQQTLEEERKEKSFPFTGRSRPPRYASNLAPSPTYPGNSSRRGGAVDFFDDEDDFDEDDDEDDFDDGPFADFENAERLLKILFGSLTPEMKRQLKDAMERGEACDTATARIIGDAAGKRGPLRPQKKAGKAARLPNPGQGDLF
ncbi:MAG: hypothetical protein ACYDC6_02830 [Acidobacteriaceae bacterium]